MSVAINSNYYAGYTMNSANKFKNVSTKTEKGTFMAYASCSCTCFCVCKCQNCHSIGEANGTQIANDAQYNTTGVTNRGPILLLNN